jgi:uncharacterized membrane protein YfcA
MLEVSDYIILFLLGSLGAFVAGFLGVGGGIIYIPILDYFLYKIGLRDDVLVKGILANSLFVIIFSGLVASYKQYLIQNFYLKEVLYTAIPGLFSALFMTYLIRTGSWYSKEAFSYVFIVMLFIIVIRMFFSKAKELEDEVQTFKALPLTITGFLAGFITALSGLGGGVVMTPVFTDSLKMNIRKASSVSNGVIPFFAIAIGIYNLSAKAPDLMSGWQIGFIVMPIEIPMILATFIFAPIGVNIAQKTSPKMIRLVFASFVAIVLVKLVYGILVSRV